MNKRVLSALTLSALLSSCTMLGLGGSLGAGQDATLGQYLTGPNGMTLYLFTKDTPGVSNCYDQCAVNWPPLYSYYVGALPKLPAGATGKLSLVTRKDGTQQVAYNDMPLYYWIKDKKPGDTTGQNVGGVWFVVKP